VFLPGEFGRETGVPGPSNVGYSMRFIEKHCLSGDNGGL